MTHATTFFASARSALYRVRSNAAVLHDRVRGDVSRQVAGQIMDDADVALAAMHNLMASVDGTHSALVEAQHAEPSIPVDASTGQPDVATLIGMLLSALGAACDGGDIEQYPALRGAMETALDLAAALGVDVPERPAAPRSALSEIVREPLPPHDDDHVDLIDAAEPLYAEMPTPGGQLADEDLLAAVRAAVAVEEIREAVIVGLEDAHRRIGHCWFLFDRIQQTEAQSTAEPIIGMLADIGRDAATAAQDECLELRGMLMRVREGKNHD